MSEATLKKGIVEATIGRRADSVAVRGFQEGAPGHLPGSPATKVSLAETPEEIAQRNERVLRQQARMKQEIKASQVPVPRKATIGLEDLRQKLSDPEAFKTREDATQEVNKLTRQQLVDLAKGLGVPGHSRLGSADLRHEIVSATVGRRLESVATRGFEGSQPEMSPKIITGRLSGARTEAEGRAILSRLSKADSQHVAREVGVDYSHNDSVQKLHDAILRQTVTRRLEHAGYQRRATPPSAQSASRKPRG